jgi:penicillin amidase
MKLRSLFPRSVLALLVSSISLSISPGCSDDESLSPAAPGTAGTAGTAGKGGGGGAAGKGGAGAGAGAGGAAAGQGGAGGFDAVPVKQTIVDPSLSAPVDVVRDEHGIPHIYGDTVPDVSYAQGYTMASDRFIEMDFARHKADGTLGKLFGSAVPSVVDGDIQMRVHHMRKTAQTGWANLQASPSPTDKLLVDALTQFTAGVNAWIKAAKASGKSPFPDKLAGLYSLDVADTWLPEDSIMLGELQAFSLAFDADSDVRRTRLEEAAKAKFADSKDPAHQARAGVAQDFRLFAPVDPTYTIDGWTGMNGDTSTASLPNADGNLLALLDADRAAIDHVGLDRAHQEAKGSNNWIIGPKNTTNGHVIVANDTHLDLGNPATFYLIHLVARKSSPAYDVMGVQFPGIPAVILGNNQHLAWGSTVNNIDVTDIYQETVSACGSDMCVTFNGQPVKLVPRQEKFEIGLGGLISDTRTITLYDVPHHGPIIPRVGADHAVDALGTTELSIRYTGYESAPLLRAVYNLNVATTMQEGVKALDADFKYGGQNWVIGDDQGHIGWTQTIRVPRRAAGSPPWKILPGDGSAEWGADLDPKYIPHAYDPDKGYLVTANADPIGVTDDGDPWNGPLVDGAPLYLGSDYDPGTRAGRITKRIDGSLKDGKKLALDDMIDIQSDAVSEWHAIFAPVYLDAVKALAEEAATPGSHPELTAILEAATDTQRQLLPKARDIVAAWTSYDTPSGAAEDSPTPQQIADSQAALLVGAWMPYFSDAALGDELAELGPDAYVNRKLTLARMVTKPESLATGVAKDTKDSLLFDDLKTTDVTESKRQIAARSILETLAFLETTVGGDITTWRWGQIHTLTLGFLAPGLSGLDIPTGIAPDYPAVGKMPVGFPRHGASGTVDVADPGLDKKDFTYQHGAAIRFSCEIDPATGPHARNAIPGGETFDLASPHYRDQAEIWRKNKVFDLAFKDADVLASAAKETQTNQTGRTRFSPKLPTGGARSSGALP